MHIHKGENIIISGRSMQRRTKIIIGGVILVALVAFTPLAVTTYVSHRGDASLLALAKEGGFCTSDDCSEGVSYASTFLETNYGLSADDVRWCLGVDDINHHEWVIGNSLKSFITDKMYQKCDSDLAVEE